MIDFPFVNTSLSSISLLGVKLWPSCKGHSGNVTYIVVGSGFLFGVAIVNLEPVPCVLYGCYLVAWCCCCSSVTSHLCKYSCVSVNSSSVLKHPSACIILPVVIIRPKIDLFDYRRFSYIYVNEYPYQMPV